MNRFYKNQISYFIAALALSLSVSVSAATYQFVPSDNQGDPDDIWDLDHYKYFTWGVKNFSIPQGQIIQSAVLTFNNINNWTASENNGTNWLNVWLMDRALYEANYVAGPTADGKLKSYTDNQAPSDIFLTWQPTINKTKIGVYTDYSGGPQGDVINLSFNFTQTQLGYLTSYIQNNNNFALGFDPDCHYWNTGASFVITTAAAPVADESSTFSFLILALGLLAGCRRKLRA